MKRDVFNASGSGVKHGYTHRISTSTKLCAARCKNSVNIEEIIADERLDFHDVVKVSFLKPEKVNMLIFLWKKCTHGHRQTVFILFLISL